MEYGVTNKAAKKKQTRYALLTQALGFAISIVNFTTSIRIGMAAISPPAKWFDRKTIRVLTI